MSTAGSEDGISRFDSGPAQVDPRQREWTMKVITGTVTSGKVGVPLGALAEGAQVAILAPSRSEPVRLTRAEEEELEAAVEELRRGEFVDGADLLRELRARGQD